MADHRVLRDPRPGSRAPMTAVLDAPSKKAAHGHPPRTRRARFSPTLGWLAAILAAEVALALRPGLNGNAFEDEGTYLYFGHAALQHILHGTVVPGYPGSYFSGAPWLYPTLGAIGDSIDGLAGARAVSLLFALGATVGTFGIGKRLFGTAAGLIGAALFVLNGSVIDLSHLATFDSMAECFVALAAWLAIYAAQRNKPLWLLAVAALLTIAVLSKYTVAIYLPVVGLLTIVVGWPTSWWKALTRGAFVVAATALLLFALLHFWNQNLIKGIRFTTLDRHILSPTAHGTLTRDVLSWVGPWLVLAVVAVILRRGHGLLSAVLLLAAVVLPAEQIRIGEYVSLEKHVAFGLMFACPLIGDLLAWVVTRLRTVGITVLVATLVAFCFLGLHFSSQFLTGWVDDRELLPVLRQEIAADGNMPFLGDQIPAQLYELRNLTTLGKWCNTAYFAHDGLVGDPAFAAAIDQGYFGFIYLEGNSGSGQFVQTYLSTHKTPYHLSSKPTILLHGQQAGNWLVYTLDSDNRPTR